MWSLYQDIKQTAHGSDLAKGHAIVPGGSLVLGQDQESVGGGFDAGLAFVGDISHVNVFKERLITYYIYLLYTNGCQFVVQEFFVRNLAFKWSDFKSGVQGDAKVVEPSSCEFAEAV